MEASIGQSLPSSGPLSIRHVCLHPAGSEPTTHRSSPGNPLAASQLEEAGTIIAITHGASTVLGVLPGVLLCRYILSVFQMKKPRLPIIIYVVGGRGRISPCLCNSKAHVLTNMLLCLHRVSSWCPWAHICLPNQILIFRSVGLWRRLVESLPWLSHELSVPPVEFGSLPCISACFVECHVWPAFFLPLFFTLLYTFSRWLGALDLEHVATCLSSSISTG